MSRPLRFRLPSLIKNAQMALVPPPLKRAPGARAGSGAARVNEAFRALAAAGDRHRDQGAWVDAETAYREALTIFPEEAGYWVQHGHVIKEQLRFDSAEISYRTACALGVGPDQVLLHLRFVMECQGVSESQHPIRFGAGEAPPLRVPGKPDVLSLAKLLWRVDSLAAGEILPLLRAHPTCDALFAAMVADPRFTRTQMRWLELLREEEL